MHIIVIDINQAVILQFSTLGLVWCC